MNLTVEWPIFSSWISRHWLVNGLSSASSLLHHYEQKFYQRLKKRIGEYRRVTIRQVQTGVVYDYLKPITDFIPSLKWDKKQSKFYCESNRTRVFLKILIFKGILIKGISHQLVLKCVFEISQKSLKNLIKNIFRKLFDFSYS